ncbi:MAG: hypothetical protein ACFCU1_13520 [Sumerlaeia bacterium]
MNPPFKLDAAFYLRLLLIACLLGFSFPLVAQSSTQKNNAESRMRSAVDKIEEETISAEYSGANAEADTTQGNDGDESTQTKRTAGYQSTFQISGGETITYGFTRADIPWLVIPPLIVIGILVAIVMYYARKNSFDSDIPFDLESFKPAEGVASTWIQDQVREAQEAADKNELIITKYRAPFTEFLEQAKNTYNTTEAPDPRMPTPAVKPAASSAAQIPQAAVPFMDDQQELDNGLQSLDLEEELPPPIPLPPIPLGNSAKSLTTSYPVTLASPVTHGQQSNSAQNYQSFHQFIQQAKAEGQIHQYLGDFSLPVQPNGERYTTPLGETVLILPRMEAPETLAQALQDHQRILICHQDMVFDLRQL